MEGAFSEWIPVIFLQPKTKDINDVALEMGDVIVLNKKSPTMWSFF